MAAPRCSWPKRRRAPLLKYDVTANVGGKIAQLGSRLIDGVAKKMADQFFANFAAAAGRLRPCRLTLERALDADR